MRARAAVVDTFGIDCEADCKDRQLENNRASDCDSSPRARAPLGMVTACEEALGDIVRASKSAALDAASVSRQSRLAVDALAEELADANARLRATGDALERARGDLTSARARIIVLERQGRRGPEPSGVDARGGERAREIGLVEGRLRAAEELISARQSVEAELRSARKELEECKRREEAMLDACSASARAQSKATCAYAFGRWRLRVFAERIIRKWHDGSCAEAIEYANDRALRAENRAAVLDEALTQANELLARVLAKLERCEIERAELIFQKSN